MNTPFIIIRKDAIPVKVMDITDERAMHEYRSKLPKDTHTKEELDALHNAIKFTHAYRLEESLAKMDEHSPIDMPLPSRR
jgi:hypothetical protein